MHQDLNSQAHLAPKNLQPFQIAEAFPEEVLEFIPTKIKELDEYLQPYVDMRIKIQGSDLDQEAKAFWIKVLKLLYSPMDKFDEVKRLRAILKMANNKKTPDNRISQEQIFQAKITPIERVYKFDKIKRGVKGFMTSCTLGHEDENPSLCISGNQFYCFSCHKKGDTIQFIRDAYGLSFLGAVSHILKEL